MTGAGSGRRDADAAVLRRRLGVLHEDVEIALVVEDARVEQLELRLGAAAAAVLFDQAGVGKLRLRVLVEVFQVRVGGGGVEVEIALLDVLAVVGLARDQAEEAFLEDGIAAVPQGQSEDQELIAVADARQAVLAPAVGPAAGVVVREVVPGVAVGAVVLTHRAPGALADVGAPAPPRGPSQAVVFEAVVLGGVRLHARCSRRSKSEAVTIPGQYSRCGVTSAGQLQACAGSGWGG
jgi:hypothetical protein